MNYDKRNLSGPIISLNTEVISLIHTAQFKLTWVLTLTLAPMTHCDHVALHRKVGRNYEVACQQNSPDHKV